MPKIEERQRYAEQVVAEVEGEAASVGRVEYATRAGLAVAEHLIEERIGARLAAVRVDPPDYVTRELGERPADATRRRTWDRAVAEIESYRLEHGIGDRDSTLGAEPRDRSEQVRRRSATESIQRAQRELGLQRQARQRALKRGRILEIEM
ncbi:MAG TPA: hypothetical protein VGG40_12615 [Solirubrobacterales bacterium]